MRSFEVQNPLIADGEMIYKTEDGRPYFLYEEPSADKEGAKRTRLGIIDVESSPHVKSKETREAKASERVAVNCSHIFDITDESILKNHLPKNWQ